MKLDSQLVANPLFMKIPWEWQHLRSASCTFAGLYTLCRLHLGSILSKRGASCGSVSGNCLGHLITMRCSFFSKTQSSFLVFHPYCKHTLQEKVKYGLGWCGEVGRRLCSHFQFENVICCSCWKQAGDGEELTGFFLLFSLFYIVEVQAGRHVTKVTLCGPELNSKVRIKRCDGQKIGWELKDPEPSLSTTGQLTGSL